MKKLQIFGPGCPKCKRLADNAEQAAKSLGIEYEIEKITDIGQMMKAGIMITPALVVDNEIKSAGKVLSPEQIEEILA